MFDFKCFQIFSKNFKYFQIFRLISNVFKYFQTKIQIFPNISFDFKYTYRVISQYRSNMNLLRWVVMIIIIIIILIVIVHGNLNINIWSSDHLIIWSSDHLIIIIIIIIIIVHSDRDDYDPCVIIYILKIQFNFKPISIPFTAFDFPLIWPAKNCPKICYVRISENVA